MSSNHLDSLLQQCFSQEATILACIDSGRFNPHDIASIDGRNYALDIQTSIADQIREIMKRRAKIVIQHALAGARIAYNAERTGEHPGCVTEFAPREDDFLRAGTVVYGTKEGTFRGIVINTQGGIGTVNFLISDRSPFHDTSEYVEFELRENLSLHPGSIWVTIPARRVPGQ